MCLGIPGRIIAIIDAADAIAMVEVGSVRRPVNVSFILDDRPAESCIGEWVLVHVGFAMSKIDEAEAMRTLELLQELGEMQAELEAMQPELDASQEADASREAEDRRQDAPGRITP